jgi:hypothetical protein
MATILDVTLPPISAWTILIAPPATPANFIEIGQGWGFSIWWLWRSYWMSRDPQFRHGRSLFSVHPIHYMYVQQ